MIAFGCAISEVKSYAAYAEPGIRLARESDSVTFPFSAVGTIGRSYNLLLEAAAAYDDLEALVLVHPHAQIHDPQLCAEVRRVLQDPEVAVAGSIGATGVTSLAWWEGEVVRGPAVHRYPEFDGGEVPALAWTQPRPAPAEVEVVDGFLLVLSPWAVREVRFDEGLIFGHGFELDFCLQIGEAGRKVVVADLGVTHHRALRIVDNDDLQLWSEAHIQLARKWGDRLGGDASPAPDWKQRARRAEAERDAARAMVHARKLALDARIDELHSELLRTTATRSWRLTRPLREVNRWRRERAAVSRNGAGPSG